MIYANQITRSIYKPIKNTLQNILRYERSYEAEKKMLKENEAHLDYDSFVASASRASVGGGNQGAKVSDRVPAA